MDESFCSIPGGRYPDGEPNSEWTIEELLHWSHDQYRERVVERASQHTASLREQCERECADVMMLHETAVEMANKAEGGSNGEENTNPQLQQPSTGGEGGLADSSASAKPHPAASSSAIEIQMTVGPHASSKFLLRPRLGQACLLGRSKGKKFVKNGISLHKDQEVSTTHGKFMVEGGMGLGNSTSNTPGGGLRFYFVDVGSTNGTVYNGEQLEPNRRLLLEDGMELKVGNSVFKVILG